MVGIKSVIHSAWKQTHSAEHDLMEVSQRGGIEVIQTIQGKYHETVFRKCSLGYFIHNQFLLPWPLSACVQAAKNQASGAKPAESLIPLVLCNTKGDWFSILRARLSAPFHQIVGEVKVGRNLCCSPWLSLAVMQIQH